MFLREFFAGMINILVVTDAWNRYNLICRPEKKNVYLSKKVGALETALVTFISVMFSGVCTLCRRVVRDLGHIKKKNNIV